MNDPDSHSSSAKRRRLFGRRRASTDGNDSVQIGHEDTHAWWAGRESLDHLVSPKPRGARARRADETDGTGRPTAGAPGPNGAPTDHRAASTPRTDPPPPADRAGNGASSSWRPEDVFAWADADPAAGEPAASTPWDVLGLSSSASWTEVSRRHKLLAKEHHPDRVAAADATTRQTAAERMADINAAFSELRRIYRLTDSI